MNQQPSSQPNFWNAPFDEISLNHIEWLKEMEFEEGLNLDYKKEVKDKECVLRDLVSLANANGGYLLYGIVGEPRIADIKGIQEPAKHERERRGVASTHLTRAAHGEGRYYFQNPSKIPDADVIDLDAFGKRKQSNSIVQTQQGAASLSA